MLFKFFTIIFLIGFLMVSLLGVSVLRSFRNFFFGDPKRKQRSASQSRQSGNTKSSANRQPPTRKKIIAPDEGEYVDYVEIKD